MKRIPIILPAFVTVLMVVSLACGSSPTLAPTVDVNQAIASTLTAVALLLPTNTSIPIASPTDVPTNTPPPTNTPTPKPNPITLSGSGDSVVDIQKWEGLALAHFKHTGGGNFAIINYGAGNERIDLLVNTIGNYDGTRPLDFMDNEETTRFEVTASGPWEIQILPFDDIRKESVPAVIQGNGDDVVLLTGDGEADTLTIDANQADGNFAIFGWGSSKDLLVNEIAPYNGTVLIPNDLPTSNGALALEIIATGPWSIDVKTR